MPKWKGGNYEPRPEDKPSNTKYHSIPPGNTTTTPARKTISDSFLKANPKIAQEIQNRGYYRIPSVNNLMSKNPVQRHTFDLINPERRGYWEDPRRIAKYHTFIRNSPPDWKKPDWLDADSIEAAHKYFTDYQGNDWTKWKYLNEEDEATRWLRDLQMPPPEFLFPEEAEEIKQQIQINTWDDLYLYQQAKETIFTPQPLTAENPSDRAVGSIWGANTINSILQGVGGYGMGKVIGTVGLVAAAKIAGGAGMSLAAAAASPAVIAGGAVLGAALFFGSMWQFKTGEKAPIVGDIIENFGITSIFGKGFERLFGTGRQMADEAVDGDMEEIMNNLSEAWKVSEAFYEVSPTEYTVNHLWQLGAEAVGAEGATEATRAEPGEVYRWGIGQPDPQKLPEGYKFGVDALEDMRVQLIALDEDDDGSGALAIIQDYKNQFGTQGITQDFVAQMFLDPSNWAATYSNVFMRKMGMPAEAFPVPTATNIIVDGLPLPLNMIAPIISGGKWAGTVGLIDGLTRYQTFIKTGYMPGYQGTPEDHVPPKDFSPGQKALGDLSDEGYIKEYMPYETITTGPLPGIRNYFKKMVSLTPEAKAEDVYSKFMDYMGNIAMRSNDPDMIVKLLKTAGAVDTETTAQAFVDIMKPLGLQEGEALVNNYVHPIGGAFADSFRKLDGDDFIDNFKHIYWDSTRDRKAILSKAAQLLEIDPHDLLDQLGKDVDIAGALKIRAAEKGLEGFEGITNQSLIETMSVFGGKDPLPIDVREFNFMLVNKYGEMLSDQINARFGIGKDSTFKKFAGVLKDVQSLLVLDYNPGYFINNAANNILWSAAHGSYGLTSRSRMVSFLERLEITPTRMDMGFSEDSRVRTDFGIDSEGKVTKVSDIVKAENDILSVAGRGIKDVRRKLGIFNRLSSMSEMGTSRQIYYKAIRSMQTNLWRKGKAIRPLPDSMNKLQPEVQNRIYEIMENSLNSREIDENYFTGGSKLTISEISGRVFERLLGNYEEGTVDIDSIREMAYTTGLIDEVDSVLATAKTPTDVDNGFAEVESRLQDTIQKAITDELLVRAEDVKTRVQSEGTKALMSILMDVEEEYKRIWIKKDEDFIDLHSRDMDKSEFNRQYYLLRKRHDRQFASVNDWRKVTLEAVYEGVGVNKDNPSVKIILDANKSSEGGWNEALLFRDDAYKPLFEETFENQKSYDIAKAEIDRKIQEKFDYAQDNDLNCLRKKNEAYISLAKDKEAARAWTEQYTEAFIQLADERKVFLQGLRDNPPANQMEKSYRWQEFFREQHEPMIVVRQALAGSKRGMVDDVQSIKTQMDADAKILDTIINEGGKPEDTFQDAQQLQEIYDYWSNDWLAKNTIREIFIDTGRYGDDQASTIIDFMQLSAENWARKTGNHPREYFNKYIREIKYASSPEDVLFELSNSGTTSSTRNISSLMEAIEGMPDRISIGDLDTLLKSKVKRGEIKETGFDGWIKQQGETISKVDALEYIYSRAVRIDRILGTEVPELIISKPYMGEGDSQNIVGRILFSESLDSDGRKSLAIMQLEVEDTIQSVRQLTRYAVENGYDRIVIPALEALPKDVLNSISKSIKTDISEQIKDTGVIYNIDITDEMRQLALQEIPLQIREMDIFSLANKYGIPTATAEGKPNNRYLINVVNKYGKSKYKRIEDIPLEIAQMALEKMRMEKGDLQTENSLQRSAIYLEEDSTAVIRLAEAANIGDVVNATGKLFRKQLDSNDLEVLAKAIGLDSAEELVRLEQKIDSGTITDAERTRYIESENKSAELFEKYIKLDQSKLPKKVQPVIAQYAQWMYSLFNTSKNKYGLDINATIDMEGQQVMIIDVLDRMFVKLEGENPLGTTPQPMPVAKSLSDGAYDYIYPLLDTMKRVYKENYQDYKSLTIDDIPDNLKSDFIKWINLSKQDLAATKLTSMNYAEAKRDHLLHNYSRRTGFDELLSYPFPYLFWYTKSMVKWGAAMLDQPKLYATYARYKEMQKELERQGIPNRMRGKIRMNAPYLPKWMGGGLWQDPMKQLFPFAQMEDPAKRQGWMENSLKHEAYKVLDGYVEEGIITKDQAVAAKESQSGQLWDSARSEAGERLGTFDAVSLASVMASPAMYWDIPWKLATGRAEKISPTPLLKTTQAVETLTQDTFLSGIGKMIGGIGKAEEGLRRKVMTPAVAMFGEYGDYYVDRQLANMVADGEVGARQAKMAMVERTGEVYAMAVNRVREEVALRVPGAATVMAAKNGANLPQFAASVFHSLNPSGLLPEGELEYLNLKDEYSYAWEMYNRGYKDQLTQFFEDHPVFEARIAIKDDPDERLQNFLVSEVWDRYMSLDSANKQLVHNQLGPQFSDTFMEQRVYDAIPVDKLALWAHSIGSVLPQVEGVPMMDDVPMVEQWSEDAANSYQVYSDTRNEQFPNWYAIQTRYFDQPKNKRRSYLSKHPELKEYWDWKNEYRAAHPEIEPILAYKSAQYQQENETMNMQMLEAMPDELTVQLQSYSLLGTNMGPGAWEALRYVWEKSNKPYGNLKEWVDEVVVNSVR